MTGPIDDRLDRIERALAELVARMGPEDASRALSRDLGPPIDSTLDRYLADVDARCGARHAADTRNTLRRLRERLPELDRLGELNADALTRFRDSRAADGVSRRTLAKETGQARALLRWAVDLGLLASDPAVGFRDLPAGERHARHRRRALSDAEAAALLEAARADDRRCGERFDGPRIPQAPLAAWLLDTGARFGESAALRWGAVSLEARSARLDAASTKSGRERPVPLSDALAAILGALRARQTERLGADPGDAGRVFLSPAGRPLRHPPTHARFRRWLAAAGIPAVGDDGRRVDLHALRRTAVSRWARAGVPLAVAQRLAGHSTPRLTATAYVELDLDALRAALADASALSDFAS